MLRAEDLGVDVVFNWDHFFPLTGDPDGKHFECWTMLGAWAEQTERVEIGALVSGGGYRNPDLLADMARTVDHISGGRLIFGHRRRLVREGLRRVRLPLRHPRQPAEPARREPGPDHRPVGAAQSRRRRRPIPVLIGGGGERKTLRHVARYATIWHAFGGPDTQARKAAILAEHCAAVGRDPGQIERSTAGAPSGVRRRREGPARPGRHPVHHRGVGTRLRPGRGAPMGQVARCAQQQTGNGDPGSRSPKCHVTDRYRNG